MTDCIFYHFRIPSILCLLLTCMFTRNIKQSVKTRATDGNFISSLFIKTCMKVMMVAQAIKVLNMLWGRSLTLSVSLSLFLYHSVLRPFLSLKRETFRCYLKCSNITVFVAFKTLSNNGGVAITYNKINIWHYKVIFNLVSI